MTGESTWTESVYGQDALVSSVSKQITCYRKQSMIKHFLLLLKNLSTNFNQTCRKLCLDFAESKGHIFYMILKGAEFIVMSSKSTVFP